MTHIIDDFRHCLNRLYEFQIISTHNYLLASLPLAVIGGVIGAFFLSENVVSPDLMVGFITVIGIVARIGSLSTISIKLLTKDLNMVLV